MAKNGNGRNSNIAKWIAIIIGLGLALTGWVYNLGVQGEKLKANCADDANIHPKVSYLENKVTKLEVMQDNIQRDISQQTTIQQKILEKQDVILREIRR